ncbi:conjugative transfer signal peptidase TraF [Nitrosospira lacus]|uniref:Conjugative transfer signal peptidase TraF n=2 Tax=Nitrosospira lacus TaxID=1288494 RepID=A0A1W6SSP3_9PROT|nr:conjugative transfer signal peptidase TraF [Nitrosospira lacus]
MTTQERIGRILAVAGVTFVVLGLACFAAGGRFNSTRSIPLGLYWLTDDPVKKGEYVIFCPPISPLFDKARARGYIAAGFCPGDYGFMMKRVLAGADDLVVVAGEGVSINGKSLSASMPLEADKAGRAMPRYPSGTYTLGKSELLLMSDMSATSFDGRYFGPVDLSQIKGVIRPVITF